MNCHKCPDIQMVDDGEWFVCPCCRCRTRGREREQVRHEARMAELGMAEDEYSAHCAKFIDHRPLTDGQLARLRVLVGERAENWQPACEHDTNPWK